MRKKGNSPSVIVGYGHAGRDLHHRALRDITGGRSTVIAVDPRPAEVAGGEWVPDVRSAVTALWAAGHRVADAVFHVAVPPDAHRDCLEQLLRVGAQRFILEKPIAHTVQEAAHLVDLVEATGAMVLPMSVWPASRVTEAAEELVASGTIGEPVSYHMEQSKPRFRRSLQTRGHGSAFEVELPHQLLLALHLAGSVAEVTGSRGWDLPLPTGRLARLGGAEVTLRHTSGARTTLYTDLASPVRRRRLHIHGTEGTLVADYPVSGDDDFGQVRIAGRPVRKVVQDAPLTRFIEQAYAHFRGEAPAPRSDLALHLESMELLDTARAAAFADSGTPAPQEAA
ncbi:Gfo/Idh/MocA family oxidoreductase [Streptomyces sp. A0642]|uniref:Gfo/Idh/MocA family protein n=1 Tax=Streptomyces sp. A0642 TaxID=2563100 RepID=UPI0010A26D56|nr:Gfo/Idh/MocA family oxidoreductase [Streptomyces sp. A0642]THA63918.1 Gfo/Idh/MocA family oxidoreductase [Streptomyces sp. A0642]